MSAEEILHAVVAKKTPAERAAYLDSACGSDAALRALVEGLLQAHDAAGSFLEQPLFDPAATTGTVAASESPGTMIGPYKLLEEIGEGGFGVVFMAEQQHPVRRKVALKILKPGMDTRQVIARFEAERQALALMEHPNIAQVFDGGQTPPADAGGSPGGGSLSGGSSRPYFVMELVKGIPITEYCDQDQMTPRQRLELFLSVCQAVQHAHQKGIIHRDLKPSNVLVTRHDGTPVVKVIDFGVAKATGPQLTEKTLFTNFAQMIGTPLYMSPEQAALSGLDVDTRSDIYSLGVLLYELLTGTTPFEKERFKEVGYDEMRRIIREDEPPKPSMRISTLGPAALTASTQRKSDPKRLGQLLRGELDWIVMKCLEKDRNRRYETASALAADVQRYLADEPVLAGPPSTVYRLHKFVRRNKVTVVAAALVVLSLLGGIAGATWQALRAESAAAAEATRAEGERLAKQQAQAETKRAEAGEQLARERLVQVEAEKKRAEEEKQIAQSVREFFQAKLLGQADLRTQADALLQRGGLATAANRNVTVRELLDRAAAELTPEKIEANFPNQPVLQAEILQTAGATYRGVGEFAQAVALLERAGALHQQHLGPDHPDTLTTLNALAGAYHAAGKLERAIPLFEQVRDARTRKLGPDHSATLATLNNLASAYHAAGNLPRAIQLFEQVLDTLEKKLGPDHHYTLTTLNNLGRAYQAAGKVLEAVALFERIHDALDRKLGADHPDSLAALHNLAGAYRARGRFAQAIALYEQVRDARMQKLGSDHPDTLATLHNLALTYKDAGRLSETIQLLEQVRDAAEKKLGPDHPDTLITLNSLAVAYQAAGKLPQAVALFEQVRDARQRKLGPDHLDTLTTLSNLALAYRASMRLPEAITVLEHVRDRRVQKLGSDHPETLMTLHNLALAYSDSGRVPEAISLFEHVRDVRVQKLGTDHPNTLGTLDALAGAYRAAGRLPEAIALSEQVLDARTQKLGPDHPDTLATLNNLGVAYWKAKQLDRSIPLFEDVLKRLEAKLGRDHPDTLMARASLGVNYRDAGRLDEAVPLLEEAYRNGRPRAAFVGIGNDLLAAYVKAGKAPEAIKLIEEQLTGARKQFPSDSPRLADALASAGKQLLDLKQYTEAEPILRECLILREKLATNQQVAPWQVANVKSLLGGALLGHKMYAEAEPLLVAGAVGLKEDEKAIPPQGRSNITDAIGRLIDLHDATGKKDEAAKWRQELEARRAAEKEGPRPK